MCPHHTLKIIVLIGSVCAPAPPPPPPKKMKSANRPLIVIMCFINILCFDVSVMGLVGDRYLFPIKPHTNADVCSVLFLKGGSYIQSLSAIYFLPKETYQNVRNFHFY